MARKNSAVKARKVVRVRTRNSVIRVDSKGNVLSVASRQY